HSVAANDTIRSLTSRAKITLSRGSLSIAAESAIHGDLSLINAATLAGSGDLTVTGTLTWSNGTMRGPGTTTVAPGGVLNLDGDIILDGRMLGNAGTATWSGPTGRISMFNEAAIHNLAGATFTITNDLSLLALSDTGGGGV